LARVQLKFSASADTDVRKVVLQYDLDILPILMEFPRHAQAEFPLEAVDAAAVGKWMDDRIIDFVKSYLAMTHNQYYLKGHLVTDPIAGVMFPKFAAAATAEHNGKSHYFISEKTRDEFLVREGGKPAAKHSAS
jgi:YHS domain-containing protein